MPVQDIKIRSGFPYPPRRMREADRKPEEPGGISSGSSCPGKRRPDIVADSEYPVNQGKGGLKSLVPFTLERKPRSRPRQRWVVVVHPVCIKLALTSAFN